MIDWELFFPPGMRVTALPSWQEPKLYLPEQGLAQRWKNSSFLPAYSWRGRLYRFMLRSRSAAGLLKTRIALGSSWSLGEFAQEALPQVASLVAMVGPPSPVQKVTARLLDEAGQTVGYLKYAEKARARQRLRQEHRMLCTLPVGAGPVPLKYASIGPGEALLSTPVSGKPLPAALPPIDGVVEYLRKLVVSPGVPIEIHPWAVALRERGDFNVDPLLEPLKGRNWSVVIQHGDLAPWNMLLSSGGTLRAVDWEYGAANSLPYLDLSHYFLQVSALIHGKEPLRAMERAANYLAQEPLVDVSYAEALALVRLAAYDWLLKHTVEDGYRLDKPMQAWRTAVFGAVV